MEPEVSIPHSQVPATCPIVSQLDSIHASTSLFLKIHLNIILPSRSASSKRSLPFRFPHQNPVYTSPLPRTYYIPCPSHSSRLDHPNNIRWTVHNNKLLIVLFFPLPCYLVSLRLKDSPYHSKTLLTYVPPSMWATKFHTHTLILSYGAYIKGLGEVKSTLYLAGILSKIQTMCLASVVLHSTPDLWVLCAIMNWVGAVCSVAKGKCSGTKRVLKWTFCINALSSFTFMGQKIFRSGIQKNRAVNLQAMIWNCDTCDLRPTHT